ncbi:hypothetical protein L3Q82_007972 [Scortum barcoo]|uniref:Uncharacterized protein n=1 Tax=Scortum barcoo TaxID=214431 RepID=A0ACB8WKA7_9TELE|nr:hypothetical protein L3Q82_007972 [Scortum barcoo]
MDDVSSQPTAVCAKTTNPVFFLPSEDDNECQNVTDICGDRGNCTNIAGGYYCTCVSGYTSTGLGEFQPNDGTECVDIDECKSGQACGPNSHCHNTNGSFYCSCQRDYIPTSGTKYFHPARGGRCKAAANTETCNTLCLQLMSTLTEPQSQLKEIVKKTSGELTSVEVIAYVEALSRSASALAAGEKDYAVKPSVINSTLTKLVKAVNNLVEKDELVVWSRMKEERREQTITKLLHTVEESALTLANNYKTPAELEIKATEMELKLFTFDARHIKAKLSASMAGDHINLTPKLRPEEDRNGSVSVVFVRYDSIGDILKPSSDPGVTDYSRYAGTGEITVNSQVIAAAVKPADVYQLDHVTFTLRHNEQLVKTSRIIRKANATHSSTIGPSMKMTEPTALFVPLRSPQPIDTKADVTKCAFWEYAADSLQGHWATHGCKTVHVNSNATTCSCNHLTHFAILMSSGRANLVAHYTILTRITQLGMIISLICLSMCIFTFWFFSEIQSTRTTIHKNLCCSLFMAEFIFLVGINMNTHKLFCSVIAGLLHYFFLAAFAWMCIEGIHLYLIVVGVIYNKGFLHRNFYVFGYGSPAVVVAISATLGSKYYGTDKMCWLSTENHFIWSFIGPACLIILVNLLAFGVIIYKVYRHTAVKKPEISHYENIRSCARGAMALLFVLGATWTFGVLHILRETTLTAYLFTITNAFQGMFIFIFLCVLSRKVNCGTSSRTVRQLGGPIAPSTGHNEEQSFHSCQSVRYDLALDPKKTYEYKYEGRVNFGLGMPNLAESGVRMTCKVKIVGVSAQTFILQVSDLAFEEFNGFPGKNGFDASPKLSQRIAAQLVKPFMFDYADGHVGNIRASAEIPDTVVNIVRGILAFFQVTVKTTQRVYELEEVGIHGKCQSSYATEENAKTKDMTITQVVDVSGCREKVAIYRGMATAVLDKVSKQRGESIMSTVRYVYTVKPTAEGGLITRAHGLEQQHFSPFNVKGGSFKMQAVKEMVLLGMSDTARAVMFGPLESKGDLVYKFVNAEANFPIIMQNLEDPLPKAIELVKRLAEANKYHVDSATTEDTIKLYQLLRVMPYEGLEDIWKQCAGNEQHRHWFLDMVAEVNDARILKFVEMRFQAGDISASEAVQILILSMNHLQPIPELVEMAKMFLNMPFSKSNIFLWNTVVLTYGSLVYKHCAYYTPCPVNAVQPLLDMATESLGNGNEADMVLALKALGNAGHPGSIKTIMRFLPGVAATPVDLPPRVLSAAVQSMRLIAARDPHSVQDITMSLFLQKNLPTELRMLAFMIMFDTKPAMALVSTVTAHLEEEKDLHVVSFAYSYLRSFARSSTPDNQFLSTACNVAVKILAPKFGRLSYHYSKGVRMDWFNDDFLIGTAAEVFMLRSATTIFPTEIMMKGKFFFIGRILQLLELGIRADGLKELFGSSIPNFKGDLSFSDFQAIFNLAVSPSAGKDSPLWAVIEDLQRGISYHRSKPFLIFDVRYFQATTLGLPLEISKFFETVSGITVNELFQSGYELKSKMSLSIPWKFTAKINVRERKFELDFPPCKNEFELLSISSNVYAVTRNIEELSLAKMTPIMPSATDSNDEVADTGRTVVKPESDLTWDSAPEDVFNIIAFAMSGNQGPEGYDAAVFYTPEANTQTAQLIVSQVGEATNWKMCIDSTVNARAEAQANFRWGAQCQTYEMSMRGATAYLPGSKPALKVKMHWTRIPEAMAELGRRIERYIPGMAFLLGFSQQNEGNVKQAVSASVVAASADSVNVKIKFPESVILVSNCNSKNE